MDHREMSSRNRVQAQTTYSPVPPNLQLYLLKNTWSLVMTPQAGQSGFDTLKQINAQVNNHSITAVMITETEILDR